MEGQDHFKIRIKQYLDNFANENPKFKTRLNLKSKTIDKCCQYIINEVKKSNRMGFADDEIFGMALHYYDENKIDIGKNTPNVKIVTDQKTDKKFSSETKTKTRPKAESMPKPKVDRVGQVSLF